MVRKTIDFISFTVPLFNIIRDYWIEYKINERYEIHHAYRDNQEFAGVVDVSELKVGDMNIKIIEEKTGKKAPLTPWDQDENVPPGDVVKIHLLLNDEEITNLDKIWLSNRHKGSRYFSWLDIIVVTNRLIGEIQINIVQSLTNDNHPEEGREWKIITKIGR